MPYYSEPPEDPRNAFADIVSLLLGIAIAMWVASMLSSCSPKVVTVPEYHTEYITRTDTLLRLDSIYKHDSVSVYVKGDTIFKDKYITLDKYHNVYKTKVDSFIKTDSIKTPVFVEKNLTKWEQFKMNVGGWCIAALCTLIAGLVAYLIYKKKRG